MTTTTTTTTTTPTFSLSRAIALQAAAEGVLRGETDWSPEELDDLVTYLAEDTMESEWIGDFVDIMVEEQWADALDCERRQEKAREAGETALRISREWTEYGNSETADKLEEAGYELLSDSEEWKEEADISWSKMSDLSGLSHKLQPLKYREGYELPPSKASDLYSLM